MIITEKRLLKWGLCCNAIYVLLFVIFRPQGINVTKVGISLILLLSIAVLFLLALKNAVQLNKIPKGIKYLFYFLLFWGGVIILRSISFSLQDTVTNFGNVYMGWAWMVPIVLILGIKIENWPIILNVIHFVFQIMIFVFAISLFVDNDYSKWAWLLRPVNLMLLIGLYRFSYIKKIKIFLIIIIYISVATFVRQRMDLLFLSLTLFFLIINKIPYIKIRRSILKYIITIFLGILTIVFTVGYEYLSSFISSIIEFQDSRTFLFVEIFEELNSSERFFGRGSLGTYYSEFFEGTRRYWENMGRVGWVGDAAIRNTIEVGYLQMILKGGYILFGSTAFIMLYAAFIALFRSNNRFIKSLGIYILLLSILSLVSFRPAFTPTFIILWIAIGTVLTKSNRHLNDDEINKLLNFK